jgi:type I restriction enzyme S subunit
MDPNTWTRYELGEVAEFINGRGFKPHEWAESGLPIIRIQNLNGSGEFNYYQGTYDPKIEVHSGDLLFAWSGSRGTSFGPHFWNGGKAVLNYHTWRVVVTRQDVDRLFFYHVLRFLTNQIEEEAHGAAALVHTQKNRVEKYRFTFPPLDEQRSISALLGTWDRGIRQLNHLITAKLRFKQGLMQQLLTGKRRFGQYAKQPWQEVRLADVAVESSQRNGSCLGVDAVMAVTKAEGMVPMREETIGASRDRYKLVRRDWFAYNPMRVNIGSIARWTGEADVLVSPDYVVFRCKTEDDADLFDRQGGDSPTPLVDPDFLDHFRRSRAWEQFVAASGNGSVRVRIYFDDLGHMWLRLPPIEEQKHIAAVLNTLAREIELLRSELDAIKQQKKGLMQKLLTGEVRVKV